MGIELFLLLEDAGEIINVDKHKYLNILNSINLNRSDPCLIDTVNQLQDDSYVHSSLNLQIVNIPDDCEWKIKHLDNSQGQEYVLVNNKIKIY